MLKPAPAVYLFDGLLAQSLEKCCVVHSGVFTKDITPVSYAT